MSRWATWAAGGALWKFTCNSARFSWAPIRLSSSAGSLNTASASSAAMLASRSAGFLLIQAVKTASRACSINVLCAASGPLPADAAGSGWPLACSTNRAICASEPARATAANKRTMRSAPPCA